MKKELIVFPTSRAIRDTLENYSEGFLPTLMGMGDFLDRVILSENVISPDNDLRLLALHEASNFSTFDKLLIERNFFTFIQNSSYIFRFFEELSGEMVSIDALEGADVYGEYEEHIAILKQLWLSYAKIVQSRGWSDPIFSKSAIVINEGYVKGFETITVYVEGYLSRYELEVLRACAAITQVECIYYATTFNEKMSMRFRELSLEIEAGYQYRLNLSDMSIVESFAIAPLSDVTCEVFHNRLVQVGFVKAQIAMMVESGISPERIVVVTPDEAFARYLRMFDEEQNFNFAMGTSLGDERVVRDIEAIELYMGEQSVENKARLDRVSSALCEWIKAHYYEPFCYDDLVCLCAMMVESAHRSEVKEILHEECEKFKPIVDALAGYEFKSALRIYLSRVKSRSIDDVRGGKITVMGLLETRGVVFDGVIVVDFNEGYVPHRSQKDLFLNTKTRRIADLPTTLERESLQKHYYWMLFQRAQNVAISCVQNTETIPSRFLLQLGIEMHEARFDYGSFLFPTVAFKERHVEEARSDYDFCAHPLSASGLKSFLTCKRQFYTKYILKIKEHEQPQDLSRERDIGNRLHAAMEKIYRGCDHYDSLMEIKKAMAKALGEHETSDGMERYVEALWIEKLNPFYLNEIERFSQGVRIAYHEKESERVVEGIRLTGRIDRLDRTLDGLEVLDYKTGNFADTTSKVKEGDNDYQLAIYGVLAQEFGNVSRCGYYDLKTGKIVYEQFLEEKIEKLQEILRGLALQKTWVWELSEDLKHCRYCPYTLLCQREL
ncbi:MAG: PD-(D/E)XK nuclease family protein [Sulfuricurvum sp.]|nr:PD-(D/E)XK nuclease family protein [Sulfuricurvum sp.]MDD5385980.1 PD-(D/E)XK nuclease family protein [Sulfuricurvum sp.]